MPAYNAAETLEKTYNEIPFPLVDEVILVDDYGQDNTVEIAKKLGINHVIRHEVNKGYGGNQKTCYNKAIEIKSINLKDKTSAFKESNLEFTPIILASSLPSRP